MSCSRFLVRPLLHSLDRAGWSSQLPRTRSGRAFQSTFRTFQALHLSVFAYQALSRSLASCAFRPSLRCDPLHSSNEGVSSISKGPRSSKVWWREHQRSRYHTSVKQDDASNVCWREHTSRYHTQVRHLVWTEVESEEGSAGGLDQERALFLWLRACMALALVSCSGYFFMPAHCHEAQYGKQDADMVQKVSVSGRDGSLRVSMSWFQGLWWFLRVCSLSLRFVPLFACYPVLSWVCPELWWYWHMRVVEGSGACLLKFYQWASTRSDMFSPRFCRCFSRLHTAAPAHSLGETEEALRLALGDEHGYRLDPQPIGSGCIATVYRATDAHNSEVAIKVVHPHVRRGIERDLLCLQWACDKLERWIPSSAWWAVSDAASEFAALMRQQLDLHREADNLRRFARLFKNDAAIHFPQPLRVCPGVLIMTYEAGTSVARFYEGSEEDGQELQRVRSRLAKLGLDAFCKMLFQDNFVHCDLHPGNILVRTKTSDSAQLDRRQAENHPLEANELELVFLDAGLVTELGQRDRDNLISLLGAVGNGDGQRAGRLLLDNASRQNCQDTQLFCDAVGSVIDKYIASESGESPLLLMSKLKTGELLAELSTLARTHQVKLEGRYVSVFLAMIVVEGVGRSLDPTVNILGAAWPLLLRCEPRLLLGFLA